MHRHLHLRALSLSHRTRTCAHIRLLRPQLTLQDTELRYRKSFSKPFYSSEVDVPRQWQPFLPRPCLPANTG